MQHDPQKFLAYLRVSTARQGRSGLGLQAQRESVRCFATGRDALIIAEYVEIETGSRNDRPKLREALNRCRVSNATLLVAKLDRLSRSAAFLMALRDSGVDFVTVDLPSANTMTVGVMAVVAQYEREAISVRTKAALAAARGRGVKLGGHRAGAPDIGSYKADAVAAVQAKADEAAELRRENLERLVREGISLNAIAKRLNEESVTSSRGRLWNATTVKRMLARLAREPK